MKKIFFDEQGYVGTIEGNNVLPIKENEKLICSNEQAEELSLAQGSWLTPEAFTELQKPTLEQAKADRIAYIRRQANSLLSLTDYKILRQSEQETMLPQDFSALKAQRQEIRDACNSAEVVVNGLQTVEEVLNLPRFRLTE